MLLKLSSDHSHFTLSNDVLALSGVMESKVKDLADAIRSCATQGIVNLTTIRKETTGSHISTFDSRLPTAAPSNMSTASSWASSQQPNLSTEIDRKLILHEVLGECLV